MLSFSMVPRGRELPLTLIDTHAHLDEEAFRPDRPTSFSGREAAWNTCDDRQRRRPAAAGVRLPRRSHGLCGRRHSAQLRVARRPAIGRSSRSWPQSPSDRNRRTASTATGTMPRSTCRPSIFEAQAPAADTTCLCRPCASGAGRRAQLKVGGRFRTALAAYALVFGDAETARLCRAGLYISLPAWSRSRRNDALRAVAAQVPLNRC